MSDYSSNLNSALLKARQVAAKLQIAGQGGNNNKRSLDDLDDEPHSKRFSGGSDWSNSSMSPAHLQQAQQAAAQVAARLSQPGGGGGGYHQQNSSIPNPEAVQKAKELISKMIPQTNNMGGGPSAAGPGPSRAGLGATNYEEIMIPGSKVGLIIGKGGETIKQLQERTGAKMVVVQEGPGQEMEKPLRISGDPQKVEHAKQLVFELIQDKGDSQQSNNRGGSGGGGGGGGGGYNNRNQDRDQGGHGGHGGGGGYQGGPPQGGEQLEIFVPKLAVGVVIGKGGDMIKKIQAETGCRLQFLQTKNDGPGDRRCIIQGTKQQVDDGKRSIDDLIESVLRRNNGNNHQGDWNGSGGSSNSGGYQGGHQGGQQGGVQVQQEQYQFVVPASKCGIIIGRSGDTIKQINSQSGAHCEMDRKVSSNQTVEKTFTVKGEQHQVDEAKRLIQEKINMDIQLVHLGSQTVTQQANGYGGGSAGGAQGAQNPYQSWGGYGAGSNQGWDQGQAGQMPGQTAQMAQGQPDFSQQWIEYYRSMGMTREAEAIEAQVKAKHASTGQVSGHAAPANGAATAAAAQPGGQGTQDYSAEWANYYRSLGKIEEAEAIEKQIASSKGGQGGGAPAQPGGGYPGAQNMAAYQQYPHQYSGGYQGQQQQYQPAYGGFPGGQQNSDKNCFSRQK